MQLNGTSPSNEMAEYVTCVLTQLVTVVVV